MMADMLVNALALYVVFDLGREYQKRVILKALQRDREAGYWGGGK